MLVIACFKEARCSPSRSARDIIFGRRFFVEDCESVHSENTSVSQSSLKMQGARWDLKDVGF